MAVFARRRDAAVADPAATTVPGRSLAKGPVGLMGIAGIVAGVIGLLAGNRSFRFHHVPHGAVPVHTLAGVGINGWTDLLFIAAGLALLIGAPAHWLAKGHAFLVACVLGAAAIIAAVRGNGIFGIFAANHTTEIIWGAAAVALLLLSLLPRVGRRTVAAGPADPAYSRAPVAEPAPVGAGEDRVRIRRDVDESTMVDNGPVSSTRPGGRLRAED